MQRAKLFMIRAPLTPTSRTLFAVLSFALPLAVWCAVSYVPWIWHPMVMVSDPGSISYFKPGQRVPRETFDRDAEAAKASGAAIPAGRPANPVYLPAPDQVLTAFYTAFTTPPQTKDGKWLHQSLWHSVTIIFWGFLISSLIGVPLGILCGAYSGASRTTEPFTEFFRYLPAPAFGALAVAILGIYDGPKIAIIVIGTLFQQILVIANTTRTLDYPLVEAALTLGTKRVQMLPRVVIPAVLPAIFRDQRILLGWAWTYLIVAELIGTSSGITWFITQQARYQNFPNVYAAIIIIGILGITTDLALAHLGKRLFTWDRTGEAR
jgi:NitT/TauT family transport system permease protein